MRIWCCFCFGEEDCISEREDTDRMRRGILGRNGDEGKPEELESNDFGDSGGELLTWSLGDEEFRSQIGVIPSEFENEGDQIGSSRHFSQSASGSGRGMVEGNMDLGFVDDTSLAAVGLEEGCDRDSHNKRPKVYSLSLDWGYFSPSKKSSHGTSYGMDGGDYDIANDSHFLYPFHNCSVNEGFSGGGDEDECGTSKMEDLEVQMDLSDDLLHMVLSFLDQVDLCRAARVCRQWRTACAHKDFWRFLNFDNRNISVQQFEEMCHRYPNASGVNIYGTPTINLLGMKAISMLRNLEDLTLGKGQLGETFFEALTCCHMLESLIVSDATLGSGIQEIPIYHDRLRQLKIVKCRVIRVSIRCPVLETLSLKRSTMPHIVLNCPLLRDLDMAFCHKLSDAAIRSAATSCQFLESLDISNCSSVTDDTLREIALTCSNLHVLDASYCPNISLESVRLPMLTVLKLHSCEGITSASMAAISRSYMLEVLELLSCSLLTSVSLDLPRLQKIKLIHCRKFNDLNLCCIMLSSITVSNCSSLQRISITSNSLQKLVLQKQESLNTLALQCQCLQDVDLTGCESLTNSICEVFSDGGGCPMLKSLVLDSCEDLTEVGFRSNSLVSLSLAGCRAITSLELQCPYLENVTLGGCDHLERASFYPVGLRSLNLGICPKLNILHIEAPQMWSLELKGCGVLSQASIDCPILTSLDASFCCQLKDDCLAATTASCPLIESLILMSCTSVGPDGLLSLSLLPNLTTLDLSYTFLINLQPIFQSCTMLKVLKLQACKYLADSSLEPLYKEGALPSLCELDLSYGALCQTAIKELLSCCTHITHVSLNGCVNMHDLNWSFSGYPLCELSSMNTLSDSSCQDVQPNRLLQYLNCVGCPNVKKVLIPPPVTRCFHLLTLNLSLSQNLREVDVSCLNLCVLNLSNCSSLEVLRLECPKLTSLFLQSCNIDEGMVKSAIRRCNMLETLDVRFCPKISSLSVGVLRSICPSLKRVFSSLVAA